MSSGYANVELKKQQRMKREDDADDSNYQKLVWSKVTPGGRDPVRVALVALCVLLGVAVAVGSFFVIIKNRELQDLQVKFTHVQNENKLTEKNLTVVTIKNRELQDLQVKYDSLVNEKDLMEKNLKVVTIKNRELQVKYDSLVNEKDLMEKKPKELSLKLYKVDVTLDPDTAHPYLILSEDGKQVRHGDTQRNVPDNPKRFDPVVNVLGKEGFSSGRFYYEVQVKDKTDWDLGVARESVNRKGKVTLGPRSGIWSIVLRQEEYKGQSDPNVILSLSQKPQKVGVFVNYEEGEVSFYDVDPWSHIYSFTGQKFTEKLYPFFNTGLYDGGKNSAPLVITPVM